MPLTQVEHGREYLGFLCGSCDTWFAMYGPLLSGRPAVVAGLRFPHTEKCPACGKVEVYPEDRLQRFLVQSAA